MIGDEKNYHAVRNMQTVGQVRSALEKMHSRLLFLSDDQPLENASENDLDFLIYNAEKTDTAARNAMENKRLSGISAENYDDIPHHENNYGDEKSKSIHVVFKDDTLRIFTPFTFKRSGRKKNDAENYAMMNLVSGAIGEFQRKNSFSLYTAIDPPYVIVIKRKSVEWNSRLLCDNDNLENGRIVNAIASALGYSDNAGMMSLYSCVEIAGTSSARKPHEMIPGMEFIVFAKKNLKDHLGEL